MRYLSVCSGIEAATVAWHPLGWEPAAFAEIDPFACELLHFRYGCGRPMFMPDPAEPEISAKDRKARAAAIKAVARLPAQPNPGCPPNLGDLNRFQEWPDLGTVDLLVGGTPCQSFSVAGLRAGLADPRGNLALVYLAIAAKYGVRWCLWENVPGVLSSDGGRAFGSIIGGLAQLRYGLAYRVLDAQFCRTLGFAGAVPQRRRRVFVVGYLGDWRRAAAVLFDGASLRGDSAPGREAGQGVAQTLDAGAGRRRGSGMNPNQMVPAIAGTLEAGANSTGGDRQPGTSQQTAATMLIPEVANPLTARMGKGVNTTADEGQTMVGEPLAFKASHFTRDKDGAPSPVSPPLSADADKGDQDPLVLAPDQPFAFQPRVARNGRGGPSEVAYPLTAEAGTTGKGDSAQAVVQPIPFDTTQITSPENRSNPQPGDPAGSLAKGGHAPVIVEPSVGWRVRRLTPVECEKLQGFEPGYTQIPRGNKPTADGPRYKALGNSMAVNVMRVIGQRLALIEGR